MLALKIALRNIFAHAQRNLIIFVVTVAVSFFLFLFLTFSDGEIENIKNGLSSFYNPYSDIKALDPRVKPAQDRSEDAAEFVLKNVSTLRASLEALPSIQEAVPRHWNLYLDLSAQGKKFLGFNVNSLSDRNQGLRSKFRITEGRDLETGDRNVLLLHDSARATLPFRPGDRVTLVGKSLFGQMAVQEVTLIGFFAPNLDNPNLYEFAFVDQSAFNALAGYDADDANSLLIRFKPGVSVSKGVAELHSWAASAGSNIDFEDPKDLGEGADFANLMVYSMGRNIIVAMILITLFITAFGIMNVVSVNLFDRKKEIGTYFCLGSEKPFLLLTYTLEIFFVNTSGALVGIGAGLGVRELVNALAITSTDPGFQVVVGGSRFVLGFSLSSFLWILGGVSLITFFTALFTLGRALNVSPVEAVKETE